MRFTYTLTLLPATSLCHVAALGIPRAEKHWVGFSSLESLYVFGDSYSRTGFEPSETQPSIEDNPLGNPDYPGKTSSNGPNWVGYLTTTYNASSFLTYDFAGSGATLDVSIVNNNDYDVIREIDEGYLEYYGDVDIDPTTSLFAVWIGINDIENSYLDDNTEAIHSAIFDSFRYRIDTLYDSGARNFLLLSVPPLERSPRTTGSSDAENRVPLERAAVADWNDRLATLKTRIEYLHEDATVFLFDTYALFESVMDDPGQFEETSMYQNTDGYCSAYENGTDDPDTKLDECDYAANEYLWLNSLHPTFPMHQLLALKVSEALM